MALPAYCGQGFLLLGMMMKKILLALLLMIPSLAFAQGLIITKQYALGSGDNQSSTIAVTNTFQQVFASSIASVSATSSSGNTGRNSCTIQNNGSNAMYVFFGATADATTAKSVKLAAGQAVTCDNNGSVIKTAVQITGTATDVYYAAQW
jgi:hypothetical protein